MQTTGWRRPAALVTLLALVALGSGCARTVAEDPQSRPAASIAASPDPTPSSAPSASATPSVAPRTPVTGTPAPVRSVSVSDPRGDVDAARPAHWFVPSIDITGFRAEYDGASKSMELRIEFADLRALKHDRARFGQSITVASDADQGRDLYLSRDALEPTRLVTRTVASMLHDGADMRTCEGGDSTVDVDADVVLLSVPIACLTRTRQPARFTVWTGGTQVSRDGQTRNIGSDQLQTVRPVRTR